MFSYGFRRTSAAPRNGEGTGIGVSIGVGILGTANTANFLQQRIYRYATLIREGAFYLSLKSGRYLITQKPHWCRCKKERKQCKCRRSSQRIVKLTRVSSKVSIPEFPTHTTQETIEEEETCEEDGEGAQVRLYLKTEQEMDPIQLSENRLLIEKENLEAQKEDFLILRLDRSKLPRSTNAPSPHTSPPVSGSLTPTESEDHSNKPPPIAQPDSPLDTIDTFDEPTRESNNTVKNVADGDEESDSKSPESTVIDPPSFISDHEPRTIDNQIVSSQHALRDQLEEDLFPTMKEKAEEDLNQKKHVPVQLPIHELKNGKQLEQPKQNKYTTLSPEFDSSNPFWCESPLDTVFESSVEDSFESENIDLSSSGSNTFDGTTLVEPSSSYYPFEEYPFESVKDQLPSIAEETKEDSLNLNEGSDSTTPEKSSNSIHTIGSLQSVSQPTTPLPHRRNFSNNSQTSTKNSIISLTSDADVRRSSHHKASKSLDIQRTPVSEASSTSEKKKKGLMNSLKRPVKSLTRSATGLFQHSSTSPKRRSASSDQITPTRSTSTLVDQPDLSPTKEKKGILSSTKKFFRKRTVSMNI
ncbi:hypothetical protein K7432_011705 [Basidiobolus ranarum]|uniref:Uncharacterized protein n=1 Tax=Basidiobolus ranarum TaxID=34480 RepID=A0ABR2WLY9_9FUNG